MLPELSARLLNANPLIAVVDGFLDAHECARLISLAEGRMERATVLSEDQGAAVSTERTNSDCTLDPGAMPEVAALMDRLAAIVGLPVGHGEQLSVLHYAIAEEFKIHADGISSGLPAEAIRIFEEDGGQRLFTTMIYLNAVQEGGGTSFPRLGVRLSPEPGRLLLFANTGAGDRDQTPLAAHAGEPVTSGEKWVAVTWWRERAAG